MPESTINDNADVPACHAIWFNCVTEEYIYQN